MPIGYYWGDDGYGLERAADALRERVEATVGGTLERWRVTGDEASPARIHERIATAPLFGPGTIVTVVEPAPLVRSKAEREALVVVLGQLAPGNALAFLEPADASGRRSATLDALRDAVVAAGGEAREFRAPKEGQMAAWIEKRAQERSVRLARGAAQVLAERIGAFVREGDVDRRRMGQLAVGELEKLALYRPDAEVSADDVRALVPEAIPGSTWALLDAVAARRVRPAIELLERLIESTPEPVLLAQLHRRLRELIEVADHLAAGESPQSLVRILKQKPFRVQKLAEQARAWSIPELQLALEGILELDERVKGLEPATERQRRLGFALWIATRVAPAGASDRGRQQVPG
jgi:DNA polymerase III delta subunit